MNEISNEVFPIAFYFLAIIFYVGFVSKKERNNAKIITKINRSYDVDQEKLKSFLSDSEKKLLALKDLYDQDLIKLELYLEKTNQIASVVKRLLGKDIFDYGKDKNEQIINDLKKGIFKKIKKNNGFIEKKIDIDSLLNSIDDKIKKNENKSIV